MTTSPRLGFTELESGETNPGQVVAENHRYLEQGASLFIVKDKDLATPPGSPADGDAYIVAGSPTGAWSGWTARLAFYMNTGWEDVTPIEGTFAYVQDENKLYFYNGSAWADSGLGGLTGGNGISVSGGTITLAGIAITSQGGTTYTAVLADANTRIRFSNASPITFTIPPNSSVAFPTGTFIEFEQAGGGAVTAVGDTGVTLVNRSGFDVTAGQYAVAGVRKVATDTWSLTGDLA